MEACTPPTMKELFAQLGLPDDEASIDAFVRAHRPLPDDAHIPEADFWSEAQRAFLREKLKDDSDWAIVIDDLNTRLREHPAPEALKQAADAVAPAPRH
jgi:hypothetical protein